MPATQKSKIKKDKPTRKKVARNVIKKKEVTAKGGVKKSTPKVKRTLRKKTVKKTKPKKELDFLNEVKIKEEAASIIKRRDKKVFEPNEKELTVESVEQGENGLEVPPSMFLRPSKKAQAKNLVISSIEEDEKQNQDDVVNKKIDNTDDHMDNNQINMGRSVKLYRKIAVSFIFLTLVLIAVIFYFSFVKVTIILEPNQERASNNFIFDVNNENKEPSEGSDSVGGIVQAMIIEDEGIYQASGEETIGEEVTGKVKIINNYSKNQPLVATTRLLTPDNKLYRIKNTINVPAGGSIEVEVYADKPGKEMAIGPSKFTIPGLWAGLQDKIYAESQADFVFEQKIKKYIIESDINDAIFDLKKKLVAKAQTEVHDKFNDYDQVLFEIDDNSITSDTGGKVKEEKDEFNVSVRASVLVVAFDEDGVVNLAEQKFISSISAEKEVISFDKENIIYTLNNYDEEAGSASLNATFEGRIGVKEGVDLIEVDKILGLNEKQLEVYLSSLSQVSSFEVRFFPSFVRKMPKLVDRIEIEIKN